MRVTGTARLALGALRWIAAGLLLLAGYGAAGMVGGAIPANARWREPARGIDIWVESNGIHTGIVMPKVAGGIDWRDLARSGDLADPRFAGWDHVAIGWGERGFYLGTPTWADVRPTTILAAALGSDATLLHVEHVPRPVEGRDVRHLRVTLAQYRRLAAYVRASVAADGERMHGYAGYDAFYEGRGRYDALHDCNDWTGDALRHAGVRVGAWTPFPVTVIGWFPVAAPGGGGR